MRRSLAVLGKTFFDERGQMMEMCTKMTEVLTASAADFLGTSFSPRYLVLPGFCDVHVHFREPGFSYKETVRSGSMAAARGGYTDVCTMANLSPVPDSLENIAVAEEIIRRDAVINVHPYAAITVGERGESLVDMEALAPRAVAFSDDGRGVQSESMMRSAMERAKKIGKLIVAHCEDNSLLQGGYIHDGAYARAHGHRGISSESEYRQVMRDLALAKETGCPYHVCHISAKETVAAIREAKKNGVNVTCETAPHYLILSDADLREEGRFKMNPPLRDASDREALIEGILDGTIDMIATDHAPHSAEEKSRGLEKSPFGIVGIETAFPLMYTHFIRNGRMTLERLLELLVYAPRRRFSLPEPNGFSVWDVDTPYILDPADFLSMGRATPFAGDTLYGINLLTVHNGAAVYRK